MIKRWKFIDNIYSIKGIVLIYIAIVSNTSIIEDRGTYYQRWK